MQFLIPSKNLRMEVGVVWNHVEEQIQFIFREVCLVMLSGEKNHIAWLNIIDQVSVKPGIRLGPYSLFIYLSHYLPKTARDEFRVTWGPCVPQKFDLVPKVSIRMLPSRVEATRRPPSLLRFLLRSKRRKIGLAF